jgi:hypothetical protein
MKEEFEILFKTKFANIENDMKLHQFRSEENYVLELCLTASPYE